MQKSSIEFERPHSKFYQRFQNLTTKSESTKCIDPKLNSARAQKRSFIFEVITPVTQFDMIEKTEGFPVESPDFC